MTVTVPTWTIVIPMIIMVLVIYMHFAWRLLTWLEVRWVHPWIRRRTAERFDVSEEHVQKVLDEYQARWDD